MPKAGELCGIDWIRRKRWPSPAPVGAPALSIADLFCGCGGLTLGVWEAARQHGRRLDIRLAVDHCETAVAVYKANFRPPDGAVRCGNIRKLLPAAIGRVLRPVEKELRKSVGELDVLLAGPPCQGHSDLNNHTRRRDRRNSLYLRVIRAVEVLRPEALIVENVGPVVHDQRKVIDRSLERLEQLEYVCSTGFLRALDFGLPQRRKRHILLAVREGRDLPDVTSWRVSNGNPTPASRYLEGLENEPDQRSGIFYTPSSMTAENIRRVNHLFDNGVYDLPNHLRPECHRDGHSYISMYGRVRWDEPAQTITTGFGSMGQGRFVHPRRRRMITPHEAARLQGFPDFFSFAAAMHRTHLQQLIGNAVPPAFCAALMKNLFVLGVARKKD